MAERSTLLRRGLRRFHRDESGAITVDFVVLTSVIIVAVMGLFVVLNEAVFENAAVTISDDVTASGSR
jgi:Flp pilus assembly protein TadG